MKAALLRELAVLAAHLDRRDAEIPATADADDRADAYRTCVGYARDKLASILTLAAASTPDLDAMTIGTLEGDLRSLLDAAANGQVAGLALVARMMDGRVHARWAPTDPVIVLGLFETGKQSAVRALLAGTEAEIVVPRGRPAGNA